MVCPHCGHKDSAVIDSRPGEMYDSIRRRRECKRCSRRFTTWEIGDNQLQHFAKLVALQISQELPPDKISQAASAYERLGVLLKELKIV